MNQDQIDSLVRSVVKIAGGILTAHGLTASATIVNSQNVIELITGIVMAVIGFYASHTTHSTDSVPVTAPVTTVKPVTSTSIIPSMPAI